MQSNQKRHNVSAFLSTSVLVIAGLLFAVAIVYWDKGGYANNWKSLWWGLGGLSVLGLGLAFLFYNTVILPSRWQPVGQVEVQTPLPAAAPSPIGATVAQEISLPRFSVDSDRLGLTIGTSRFGFRRKDLLSGNARPVLTGPGELAFLMELDGETLVVSATFAGGVPFRPFKIERNKLVGIPMGWDINHTTTWSAVEVVDEKLAPRVQLIWTSPTEIRMNGVIVSPRRTIIGDDSGMTLVPEGQTPDITLKCKRLFKYPAWKYPGVYADE